MGNKFDKLYMFLNGFLMPFGLGENPIPQHRRMSNREAIASAWRTVGDTMRMAMKQYEEETGIHIQKEQPEQQTRDIKKLKHRKHHGMQKVSLT